MPIAPAAMFGKIRGTKNGDMRLSRPAACMHTHTHTHIQIWSHTGSCELLPSWSIFSTGVPVRRIVCVCVCACVRACVRYVCVCVFDCTHDCVCVSDICVCVRVSFTSSVHASPISPHELIPLPALTPVLARVYVRMRPPLARARACVCLCACAHDSALSQKTHQLSPCVAYLPTRTHTAAHTHTRPHTLLMCTRLPLSVS